MNDDGTKTVIDIRINDDGKKVKVTSKIRTKTVTSQVNPAIARRRNLRKFGDCTGLKAGPDTDSTSFGEIVHLKLAASAKSADLDAPNPEDEKIIKDKLSSAKISCRICKGDHFTAKCPFKDSHQHILAGGGGGGDETLAGLSRSKTDAAGPAVGTTGKYVPPGMRGGAGGDQSRGARMDGDRDDLPTVRISNLSEDTTENDVRDLIARFGHTARVFVARDRDTNTCKGFGYVTFYDKFDAERCIAALNGYGYDNLILSAELAKNKQRS
ncbi:translation initiation factor 3, subunit G [Rhizoclosmatium globosum]|uniref:Eukaryotic translation initiation factor 3 subunit G n=1 Tax=Rhizoclosmatium globosum TaxID=329046 RepID=A0A1Y2C1V7_9FUNG|nr:translation initiation factor 3, subunit G [Rhizoclosmatium globosum]|eukprot:ORY41022.1 translation initiation factor 3, subunit G [Rhizoclosmatium globosum]